MDIFLNSHENADRFAESLHRKAIANTCQTNLQKGMFRVNILGRITDKSTLAKILKRYDKHIVEIVCYNTVDRCTT